MLPLEVLTRRLAPIVCCGALCAGSLVAGAGSASATTPPDSDNGSTAALEQFISLGEQYGYSLIDPACSASPSEGTDLTYTCYAMTTLGTPFIARTSLSDIDVVEFDILAQPGQVIDPAVVVEPPGSTPDGSDAESDASPGFDALGYFDSLFSGDPTEVATLQQVTAPGSPAEAYAMYQIEFVQTRAELGGDTLNPVHVYLTAEGVLICVTSDSCVHATDLQVVNGQLVSFKVEGEDIAPRLGRATDPVPVGTSTASVQAAYRSVTGDLLSVFVELTSTDAVMFELSTAVYIDADGNQTAIDRTESIRAEDFDLKGTVTVALVFPGVDPGGEVRFLVHQNDGSAPLAAVLPVESLAPPTD